MTINTATGRVESWS